MSEQFAKYYNMSQKDKFKDIEIVHVFAAKNDIRMFLYVARVVC